MKKFVAFAVGHPVTVCMVVVAILLLGKISYDRLSVDLLPDLNTPRLFVELKAGGRPPEEIEQLFVKEIEATAVRQSDVVQVSSVVRAGSARVTVEYGWKKDMDEAFLDLQKALNPFQQRPELTELKITQHDPNTAPVVLVGLSHRTITDVTELRKVAESFVRNELVRVEGVAEVLLSGDQNLRLEIRTDPYKLAAFGLTPDAIAARIEAGNKALSGGRVSEMGVQYLVKGASQFGSEADFGDLIVGYKPVAKPETENGEAAGTIDKAPLFLKEVADVRFEPVPPDNIVRIDGERSIGLSVYKEPRANTVRVVDGVGERLESIRQALPGYRFRVITDQGTFIKEAVGEVQESALLGIVLAVIVLYLFLRRWGTTLIVSLAIPISIVATFNLMFFNGLTLNIMTLGGLALGAGMLVDNAIVVIESIFRNRERGLVPQEAAVTGTSEVGGAVIASTLTTIVVFLPIVYLHGASGALFKDQAWTVAFSLVSSLFVALLVIPMLYTRLSGSGKAVEAVRSVRMGGYGRMLRELLRHRGRVVFAAVLLLLGSLALLPWIGTEFMPRATGRDFTVQLKMPEGTRLERTEAAAAGLEELIRAVSRDSLVTIYSHVGPGSGSENAVFEGEHTAALRVRLSSGCSVPAEAVMAALVRETGGGNGLELTFRQEEHSLGSLLGSESAPVVVEIRGEELDEIAALTDTVKARIEKVAGLYNIVTSVEDGAPEITVSVDRTVAGIYDLSVSAVVEQLKQQLAGKEAGKMEYKGEMRDIVIRTPAVSRSQLQDRIIRSGEREFRLQEIASIRESQAPREIFRRGQHRIGLVTAGLDADRSIDRVAGEIREAVAGIELPAGYTVTVTGEEAKRQESLGSLMFALLLSVALVYMVLASQFESLLHPFTILLTIPLAVAGSLLLFFVTGTPINVMGVIGIVMLGGIAVNNSILLVDRIGQLKQSLPLADAIVEAGQQRIRPIFMTTLTTILALLPMAFRIGEGASLRSPMALAVIGGLVTSTLMSLAVIPCVYSLFEQLKRKFSKNRQA